LVNSMREKFKKILSSRIMKGFVLVLTLIWAYAPVVATILIWMAGWMVPIAFITWFLFGIFGLLDQWISKILILKYIGLTPGVKTLLVVEILLFAFGLVLFLCGLLYIVRSRVKKEGMVTRGPYKYIRHPQHLGIIIMALPFSLYVPGTEDLGIGVADILSWSLFALILFLWSDYEERQLAKKFGEEFIQYRSRTGSFFPKIFNKNKKGKSFHEIIYWKRYLFTFLSYLFFILTVFLLTYILSLPGIEILKNY